MNAVNPLDKISTLLGVAAIADPQQSLNAHADLLAKGQHLNSGVLQKAAATNTGAIAEVSLAAHLIDESLQQASAAGINDIYQAKNVVSHSPKIPAMMAEALKQAINNSGLFYESHLKHFTEGQRSLSAVLQEPQNAAQNQVQNQLQTQTQTNIVVQSLLPQQLAILEHQRVSWQGEVWPNQQMQWQINLPPERNRNQSQHATSRTETPASISSDITLHLPHLGKVTAKLQLNDGRVRISMLADNAQTLNTLKSQIKVLIDAMSNSGQKLEALTVVQDD